MMEQHSQESPHGNAWFDLTYCSVRLPLSDVVAYEVIDFGDKIPEKLFREIVLLERRVKQQPHERFTRLMFLESADRDLIKNRKIVLLLHRLFEQLVVFPGKTTDALTAAF